MLTVIGIVHRCLDITCLHCIVRFVLFSLTASSLSERSEATFFGVTLLFQDGVPRYARRMRQLLGRVLRNDALAELTLELDQLAGQVVATVLDFEKQDAMLGRPGPKGDPEADKRRQQARLAQQLKRKALADLLKALAQLGMGLGLQERSNNSRSSAS